MKTKLQFSDIKGMLSRDEMKKVVGGYGIGCTIYVAWGSQAYSYSGACSGSSVGACGGYATNLCNSYTNAGASGCAWSCG